MKRGESWEKPAPIQACQSSKHIWNITWTWQNYDVALSAEPWPTWNSCNILNANPRTEKYMKLGPPCLQKKRVLILKTYDPHPRQQTGTLDMLSDEKCKREVRKSQGHWLPHNKESSHASMLALGPLPYSITSI